MIIGITDSMGAQYKYQKYVDWICETNPGISVIQLSYKKRNLSDLERCSGVILSGGCDVHPELYNGNPSHPKLSGVDRQRDNFEFDVIEGMGFQNHETYSAIGQRHKITVPNKSRFSTMLGDGEFDVNSYHHQAAKSVGTSLRIVAKSEDGIIDDRQNPMCYLVREEFLKSVQIKNNNK
ncbi:MAG: gamma-glutamyl-gamma-aminobutyrate hydrolase family protein [Bacteroidota bacterium]|nr:gamma-glutamyl-gamma-aminobutyrate hydrolase family protein [Bacteroidota bacterium]